MSNLTPSSASPAIPDDLRIATVCGFFVVQRRERHFFWPFRLTTWTTIMFAGETRDEAERELDSVSKQRGGSRPVSSTQ